MNTNTNTNTHTLRKLLALCMAVAALLTMLALPASAKSASGFQYYVTEFCDENDETFAVVTGHKSAVNGKLVVPEKLNGHTVYMISAAAFSGRKDITSVVLPSTLDWVEEYAFEDCTNLKTLTVGAVYIERGAFSGCRSLKKVNITAYNYEYPETEYNWSDVENEPLFDADWEWVHYNSDFDCVSTKMNLFIGQKRKLTCGYENAKETDTIHWYSCGDYCMTMDADDYLGDCTAPTVKMRALYDGEETVFCEVVNAKGDVVYVQAFEICVRPTLCSIVRNAAQQSLLYGLTTYTIDHIRWQYVNPVLEALGIEY